jgi:hypothetical protein
MTNIVLKNSLNHKSLKGSTWWYMSIITATPKVKTRIMQLEASSGKVCMKPYLKNKLKKANGRGHWLKW